MDRLAGGHRCLAPDLRGCGDSDAPSAGYAVGDLAADVTDLVGLFRLERYVLIGHSMGGDVIVEAALTLGDRVTGIVWVDTYHRLTEPESPEQVEAFLEPFRTDFAAATRSLVRRMFPASTPPDLVDEIVEDMSSAPLAIALEALRHAFANEGPVMAALPRLKIPVVAINPDYRPTDTASLGNYGIDTVIASGVGHFLMLEDAKQFNRLLADILARRISRTDPSGGIAPRLRV